MFKKMTEFVLMSCLCSGCITVRIGRTRKNKMHVDPCGSQHISGAGLVAFVTVLPSKTMIQFDNDLWVAFFLTRERQSLHTQASNLNGLVFRERPLMVLK